MKKTLFILLPLLLIVGCSKPVEDSTLIDKDGLMYLPDSDSPYSGEVFTNYDTGEKLYTGRYENGLLIEYSYLKKDGNVKTPINDETLIEKDKLIYDPNYDEPYNGEVVMYYDTGEKEYQGTYENGLLVSYSYLHKDGSVKEPVNGENLIDRGGLLYETNGQKPYTGEVFELYDDGGRKHSGLLKGGEKDGLWTFWNENGQKKEEGNYKNDKKYGLWTFWWNNGQKRWERTYKDDELISEEKRWNKDGSVRE
jgi:antitoxin component YwqK of YwqJK toxin-antitoxin module